MEMIAPLQKKLRSARDERSTIQEGRTANREEEVYRTKYTIAAYALLTTRHMYTCGAGRALEDPGGPHGQPRGGGILTQNDTYISPYIYVSCILYRRKYDRSTHIQGDVYDFTYVRHVYTCGAG